MSPYILFLSEIPNYDTASNLWKHPINFAKGPSYFTLDVNCRSKGNIPQCNATFLASSI